jgi:outer membrane receptor protein involved in Fe transport
MILSTPVAVYAQEQRYQFNIPSQDLAKALRAFAKTSRQQLSFNAETTNDRTAPALVGTYSVDEGLKVLLDGSGLSYSRTARGVILISATVADQSGEAVAFEEPVEVVVTGTRLRGSQNETAPIIRLNRAAIEDSGYATPQDILRSMPQLFSGGPLGASEDGIVGEGNGRATNFTSASGVDLRGLGPNSTLVLLNGRRMAPSQFGQTVDISVVPISAIGSFELLTDGASALYGSDAVGGVVNLGLRRNFDGAETIVRYGDTTNGGRAEKTISQTFGERWSSGSLLASFQAQQYEPLRSNQRESTKALPMASDVLPKTKTYSGVVAIDQKLTDHVEGFVQILATDRSIFREMRTANFQEVTDSKTKALSASGGFVARLPYDWRAKLSLNYGRDTGSMEQFSWPIATGIKRLTTQNNVFESEGAEVVFDGDILELPGGVVRGAFGAAYRNDNFHQDAFVDNARVLDRGAGIETSALFGELAVPLIGDANARPGIKALDLSLAVRYDHYDRWGNTTNPRVGILYQPVDSLKLRVSYSEAFRAPNTFEQFQTARATIIVGDPMGDPNSSATVPGFIIQGSKALVPETSKSVNWGFDWDVPFTSNLVLTLNHYDIDYTNRIFRPAYTTNALRLPHIYGNLIYTLPDDAAAQALVDEIVSQGGMFYNYNPNGISGVRYVYDQRQLNASALEQSGYDITLRHAVDLPVGRLSTRLNASTISKIDTQLVDGAASSDLVNNYGYPVDWRVRLDTNWMTDRWNISSALNHVNGYDDLTQSVPHAISSWTTVDLNIQYKLGAWLGRADDSIAVSLSIQNLFDKSPPYVISHNAVSVNYDPANASPLGRFVALQLKYGW